MNKKLKTFLFGAPIEWAAVAIISVGCTIPTTALVAVVRGYEDFSEVIIPFRDLSCFYLALFIILLYIGRYASLYKKPKAP